MNKTRILLVSFAIALLVFVATFSGIRTLFLDAQAYPFITLRGEVVYLFGEGVYRHMGEVMAYMGAAQDLVTLFIAVPLLLLGALVYDPQSPGKMVLFTGAVAYIALTYTLYLFMATYNQLFIIYVLLAGISLNLFIYLFHKLKTLAKTTPINEKEATFAGLSVMGIASVMGLLWLSLIAPSIIDSSQIPRPLDHYTTLVVQGADLAFFLPWVFLSGYLGFKKTRHGYLFMNMVLVFLSLLMLALSAKIVAGMLLGEPGMPAIVLLPLFMLTALTHVIWFMRSTPKENHG